MIRGSIPTTVLALALAAYVSDGRAQQRTPSTPPATTPTQRQPSTSSEPGGTMTAQSFVHEVGEAYQKEIEVSRLATTRAKSSAVKDYAKQLVDDHTKGMEKLRKYATEKNITLPSATEHSEKSTQARSNEPTPGSKPGGKEPPEAREGHESGGTTGEGSHIRDLSTKSGAEFDTAYVQMMVDDHQKAVSLFEREHDAKLGDSDLQSFINDQLPTLRKHLSKAKDVQKDLQKETQKDTTSSTKPAPYGNPAR